MAILWNPLRSPKNTDATTPTPRDPDIIEGVPGHCTFYFIFLRFIHLREREKVRRGQRSREKKTERIPSGRTLSTEANEGLDPTTHEIMT